MSDWHVSYEDSEDFKKEKKELPLKAKLGKKWSGSYFVTPPFSDVQLIKNKTKKGEYSQYLLSFLMKDMPESDEDKIQAIRQMLRMLTP